MGASRGPASASIAGASSGEADAIRQGQTPLHSNFLDLSWSLRPWSLRSSESTPFKT